MFRAVALGLMHVRAMSHGAALPTSRHPSQINPKRVVQRVASHRSVCRIAALARSMDVQKIPRVVHDPARRIANARPPDRRASKPDRTV